MMVVSRRKHLCAYLSGKINYPHFFGVAPFLLERTVRQIMAIHTNILDRNFPKNK